MALPAGVASVRVHSEAIVDAAGNPVNGYLYLTVPQEITHAGSGMVVVPQTVKVQVSAGTFDATVVATDAAGLSLSSWTYQASEKWTGGRSFPLALPAAAPDVEYASLVPTASSAGTVMVPALVESVNGETGTVVLSAADVGAETPAGAQAKADTAQAAAVAASEPPVRAGTLAVRPSASAGKGFYLATDISGGTLYHSDGTTWAQVSGAVNPSGKILAEAVASGAYTLTSAFTDVATMPTMVIPAGSAYTLEFHGQWQSAMGTAAAGSVPAIQYKIVDVATGNTIYLFDDATLAYGSIAGKTLILPLHSCTSTKSALGSPVTVKLQAAITGNVTGIGAQTIDTAFGAGLPVMRARAA